MTTSSAAEDTALEISPNRPCASVYCTERECVAGSTVPAKAAGTAVEFFRAYPRFSRVRVMFHAQSTQKKTRKMTRTVSALTVIYH